MPPGKKNRHGDRCAETRPFYTPTQLALLQGSKIITLRSESGGRDLIWVWEAGAMFALLYHVACIFE